MAMNLSAPLSTRIAGAIAARIWFTPWSVPLGSRGKARQERWLEGARPLSFDTSHGTLRGFSASAGPTILLVHGWGDRAASMGAFITPLTEAGYRVVGFDQVGHGSSDWKQPNAYILADAIREVAEAIGEVRSVVGHSIGGLATMIALRDGLEVDSVVLISPSSNLQSVVRRFGSMLKIPRRAEVGLHRELEKRFGKNVWENLAAPGLIRGVETPALIVHDRNDPQVSHEDSELLARSWPQAQLMLTEDLGHGRILRDESVLSEAVSFIKRLESARSHSL
jgi:pimeloyl-ACP methyl ester carboxylesterase